MFPWKQHTFSPRYFTNEMPYKENSILARDAGIDLNHNPNNNDKWKTDSESDSEQPNHTLNKAKVNKKNVTKTTVTHDNLRNH